MDLEEEEEEQRQVIRWERFLPRRSLRVLLVENDDSTRHIVAALLRKCSYTVAAVADGLKAWEVLQEKHYKFDLVLAEVDMPSLSGISFLDQVTGCDLSRNIPVIMMSSQDSVNVVFKCMLKGAADFLVKPVRRNELRNLWQHVWRKHCVLSSSYTNPADRSNDGRPKSQDASGNDVSMNHDNSDAESAPKNKSNDQVVGDTQTSGLKSETEARKWQKSEELCASETRNSSKLLGKKLENTYDKKGAIEDSVQQHDYNNQLEKNKDIGAIMEADVYVHDHALDEIHRGSGKSNGLLHRKENSTYIEEIGGNFGSSTSFRSTPNTQSAQIIDFIGAASSKHDCGSLENDTHINEKNIDRDTLLPQDISLRRPGLNGFSDQGSQERHILKHSSASAFSRYGKDNSDRKSGACPATLCMSPKESTGKFPPVATINKEEVAPFTLWRPTPSAGYENYKPRNHQIKSASNNIRTHPPVEATSASPSGSPNDEQNSNHSHAEFNHTRASFHPSQIDLLQFPYPVGRIPIQNLYAGYGAILQPFIYSESSPGAPSATHAPKEVIPSNDHLAHQGNHSSYDLSSHQNSIQHHVEHEREEHTIDRERESEAYMCTGMEDQMDKHKNNGELGIVEGGRVGDITDYHGSLVLSTYQGNENGFQNVSGNCLDQGRSHREAALMKFRLKRKDRCFEKKVRYHSRKMLAEQRPRIKGQFVRQSMKATITTTGDND